MVPRVLALLVAAALAAASPAFATEKGSKTYRQGQVYCTSGALVLGSVIVPGGRCFLLAVLRDERGTFLAFVNPSILMPPGQVLRLDSTEGRRVRAQVAFLVPLRPAGLVAAVPPNTIQLVQIREDHRRDQDDDEDGDRRREETVLVITGLLVPNLVVTFAVRF